MSPTEFTVYTRRCHHVVTLFLLCKGKLTVLRRFTDAIVSADKTHTRLQENILLLAGCLPLTNYLLL